MRLLNILFYYGIIIPISYFPYPVLYVLSDGLYIVLYKLVGYRKKVVLKNISNSFPSETAEKHKQIMNEFYRHFCDLILESFKVFTISEQEVKKRMKVINPEYIDRFFDKGQSVILAGGHYNNWELFAVAIDSAIKHNAVAIYKPLSNVYFDKKMRDSRGQYGLKMISTKVVKEEFEKNEKNLRAIIFGVDQWPGNWKTSYWSEFLNQDTAMLFGTEKYAKEYNYPVVSARINKVKRGFYTFEFRDAIEEPQKTTYGEITKRINYMLEQDIIAEPRYWLWTHRRWKRKRPAELVNV